MIRFASHRLHDGEDAVMYVSGGDVLIIMNSGQRDPARRCEAVNRLLARLNARTAMCDRLTSHLASAAS